MSLHQNRAAGKGSDVQGLGPVSDTTAHTSGRIRHSHGVQAPRVGQGDLRAVR